MDFVGRSEGNCLFSSDEYSVIINEETKEVVSISLGKSLTASGEWSDVGQAPESALFDLANASVTNLDIKVFSAGDRMYTIPKSVQNEAKKALEWHKEHKRGGTPVGMNTARILSRGGQIGIKKVRHIAKYFPRHEVDKKGQGYQPGESGFPSNGRIAWALWGGDAGQRWASAIVERENKKAASANLISNDVKSEDFAYFSENSGAEFTIRAVGDGSGIDRLYVFTQDDGVQVWDDGSWTNFGEKISSFAEIDNHLDGEPDGLIYYHLPVDSEAALVASALLDSSPFKVQEVENIDSFESELIASAVSDVDWQFVDSLTFGTEDATSKDGNYTSEERSKNASGQVRNALGRFAKMGSTVMISGNRNVVGTIEGINSANGTVSVKLANGNKVDVPANITQAIADSGATVTTKSVAENPTNHPLINPTGDPNVLDLSGILGEPRASSNPALANMPNRLPPLTSNDITALLTDWPAWVADQRASFDATKTSTPKQVTVETNETKPKALNAYNDPYLRKWLDKKYSRKGADVYPNRSWYQPKDSTAVQAKKPSSAVYAAATPDKPIALTPENSDIPPIYMAIVAKDDPQAVMDLVCLIPKNSKSVEPKTFSRKSGKWVADEGVLADLNSPTPPPVIVLDDESLKDVLSQMESATETELTASACFALAMLWDASGNPLAITAAGGLDKNKGNAEKLRRYWTIGEGGAKIRWNTGGDWTRCVEHLSKYMGPRAKGYCALRHKEMTGMWTGDKPHRQLYGHKAFSATYSDEYIRSSEAVISMAELSAQAGEAKNRIVASGGPQAPGAEFYMPLVLPENLESGDGRKFAKGAISMRELPLPLMWQIKTAQGHDGSVVVGRIDKMERTDDGVGNAYGVFDTGEFGREAERLVRGGFITGISADLDRFEADEEEETTASEKDSKKIGGSRIKITKGRIMGVTLVPKPAFQECKIMLLDDIEDVQEEPVLEDGEYVEQPTEFDAAALVACAAVVASVPVTPPAAWFNNPKLDGPTPLTVTDDGRVFGHIAAWHVDHIGMAYGTKPPRSKSGYSYFHTGVIRTEEGSDIPVGQLTLAGGHAPLEASARAAAKHYDDTASAFADVHAGEDSFGIWVSGALRPSVTPEQVRSIRASAPSGDWRPIQGSLELVAVCQVNVPGFPIARARVASGSVMALVAAGAQVLARMKADPMTELAARIEKLENLEKESLLSTAEDVKSRFASLKGDLIVSEEPMTADGATDVVEPMAVDALEKLLADVVSLYFRAHGYHWNVKGADFAQYHELFGEIYGDIYDSIDPLAENILKMGYDAPFTLGELLHLRSIDDSDVTLDSPEAMAYDLVQANDVLIAELKNVFDIVTAANEQGIANFLADRIDMHQKWAWQLKSSLVPSGMEKAEEQSDEEFFVTVFTALDDQGLIASAGGPSEEVRAKLAKSGEALPDGSYPIRNVAELKKAIHAYGRSKPGDRAKVRRHIMKRARSLKKADLIPDEWKSLSATGMELSVSVADLRSRLASTAMTAAATDSVEAGDVDPKAPTSEEVIAEEPTTPTKQTDPYAQKYTAKTQPRDGQGRFRLVLARLKQDLGAASLGDVADKVAEVENLDNAGNYVESAKSAKEVVDIVDRIDAKSLNPKALENVRAGAIALGKAISNLPLPFQDQSQKIRFSDVPPALSKLMEDMIAKVEKKIGQEDADKATEKLKGFMSGSDVFSQAEISSEMNKLLRLLT